MSATPSPLAIHEAGHAIVAKYFGFRVSVVRLFAREIPSRDGTYMMRGYMLHSEELFHVDPDHFLAVMLAGKWAVRELGGWSATSDLGADGGAGEDLRKCRALLEAIDPDTADRNFKRAEMFTLALVMKFSTLITALANELDRRRALSGEELDTFLLEHQWATQ